jgi:hypothetical protein
MWYARRRVGEAARGVGLKLALQITGLLALLLVGWLAGECAWSVHSIRPKLAVTISNIDRATIAAGAAAGNLERASRAWEKASTSQAVKVTEAMQSVNAAAGSFTTFVSKTDNSLNGLLAPSLTRLVQQQNQALLESQEKLQQGLVQIAQTTQQANKTLVDLDAQLASPEIPKALESLAESSANAAKATSEGAATMTDIRQIADKARETYLKPVNLWWVVFKQVVGYGPPIVTAIK